MFSSAVAFTKANALSEGRRDTHRQSHYEDREQTTTTHTHAHAHTRLEADAVLISVPVVKPLAAQIAAGVQMMGGRGCLHKGEHKNKGTQPLVLKPVNLRQDGEEFLKFLFSFYKYMSLLCEIRAGAVFPCSINRISQSTFSEAAPQNGGATNPSAWWRLHARLQKTNKHLHQDGFAVSMGVVCLYSTSLVHIQQSTAAMLRGAAHVHPRSERVRETGREREREREEWEEGRIEILVVTERNQWYTTDT